MTEEKEKRTRISWGFTKMEVGEVRTVYDPALFDQAEQVLITNRKRYKDRRWRVVGTHGFMQVTRWK
jgi:hypothetical protein